ncbi:MAG: DUF559 domain-containing protein [Sedimenticola sp.]
MWRRLRNRQANGYKFKRQFPVYPYIVDFVCLSEKLIVELDGGQHARLHDYDCKRTMFLECKGYKVVRFWNNDVINHLEEVMGEIMRHLRSDVHNDTDNGA